MGFVITMNAAALVVVEEEEQLPLNCILHTLDSTVRVLFVLHSMPPQKTKNKSRTHHMPYSPQLQSCSKEMYTLSYLSMSIGPSQCCQHGPKILNLAFQGTDTAIHLFFQLRLQFQ